MEATQRRGVDIGDVSDREEESLEGEVKPKEENVKEILVKLSCE